VPRKELEEVLIYQTEDLIWEEVTSRLSKVEPAKRSYCRSHRHTSEDSEKRLRYIVGHYQLFALSFKSLQTSSGHASEAE